MKDRPNKAIKYDDEGHRMTPEEPGWYQYSDAPIKCSVDSDCTSFLATHGYGEPDSDISIRREFGDDYREKIVCSTQGRPAERLR
jgi:hypothetical protein